MPTACLQGTCNEYQPAADCNLSRRFAASGPRPPGHDRGATHLAPILQGCQAWQDERRTMLGGCCLLLPSVVCLHDICLLTMSQLHCSLHSALRSGTHCPISDWIRAHMQMCKKPKGILMASSVWLKHAALHLAEFACMPATDAHGCQDQASVLETLQGAHHTVSAVVVRLLTKPCLNDIAVAINDSLLPVMSLKHVLPMQQVDLFLHR